MPELERAWADQEGQRLEEVPALAAPVVLVPASVQVWAALMGSVLVVVQPLGALMGQVLVWAPALVARATPRLAQVRTLAAPVASMPGPD